jgi:preprotein translocase subunit SecE
MTSEVQPKETAMTRLREYLRETRVELRKVVWPTREETINLTGVVLLVTLAMTVFLGALDGVFSWLFARLLDLAGQL